MENQQATNKIMEAGSWQELLKALQEECPLISHSRSNPVEWHYDRLVTNIRKIMDGHPINAVTRANGLRAKVCELVMGRNYGDPIPQELK